MGYTPIRPIEGPRLIDVPIWSSSEDLTVAPTLKYLKKRIEVVTASSTYYDPLRPDVSRSAPVMYNEVLVITGLSEEALKLRHNGQSIDMEVYIDTYTKIKKEREMGEFNERKRITEMKEGDRFERYTTCYAYAGIEVPRRSNVVWDGRTSFCIDESGEEVDSRDRVEELRGEVRGLIEDDKLTPYTVFSLGGQAHTVNEPSDDLNKSRYEVKMRNFLKEHYNSQGIPTIASTEVIRRTDTVSNGRFNAGSSRVGTTLDGQSSYVYTKIAAVLDGPYFVKWVTLEVTELEDSTD